jgi:hypothetical protein
VKNGCDEEGKCILNGAELEDKDYEPVRNKKKF